MGVRMIVGVHAFGAFVTSLASSPLLQQQSPPRPLAARPGGAGAVVRWGIFIGGWQSRTLNVCTKMGCAARG